MKEEYKDTTKSYSRCTEVEAVALANGEYPTASLPLHILESASYVVCCDGSAGEYIRQGYIPNPIIGDGNSICEEDHRKYDHLLRYISEQEANDQTEAVNYLLSQGKRWIAIVDTAGRREDHTLGNISPLVNYIHAGADVCTYIDYGVFIPCRDTYTLPCRPGQQVSIISFGARRLHGIGLVYPLSDFTNWWQGTLNEYTGTEFTVEAEGEYLLFLSSPIEP